MFIRRTPKSKDANSIPSMENNGIPSIMNSTYNTSSIYNDNYMNLGMKWQKEHLKKTWWVFVIMFAGIASFITCLIMGTLDKSKYAIHENNYNLTKTLPQVAPPALKSMNDFAPSADDLQKGIKAKFDILFTQMAKINLIPSTTYIGEINIDKFNSAVNTFTTYIDADKLDFTSAIANVSETLGKNGDLPTVIGNSQILSFSHLLIKLNWNTIASHKEFETANNLMLYGSVIPISIVFVMAVAIDVIRRNGMKKVRTEVQSTTTNSSEPIIK